MYYPFVHPPTDFRVTIFYWYSTRHNNYAQMHQILDSKRDMYSRVDYHLSNDRDSMNIMRIPALKIIQCARLGKHKALIVSKELQIICSACCKL